MAIRIRFIDPVTNAVLSDANPESLKVSWKLNESPDWSATFPKNILAMKDIQSGNSIEIYNGTDLLLEGTLQSFGDKWDSDAIKLNLSGRGILDGLYDIRAYSQAFYSQQQLLLVLGELLRRGNWRIGQINTLTDPTQTLTIDLRSEKRLLAQISTLLNGIPGVFFRYGGYIAGKHAIDVGIFGETSGVELYKIDPELVNNLDETVGALTDVEVKNALAEIINSVEVIGGDVKDNTGVTRTIILKDALTADPTLATDPDFPIVTEIADFVYYIRNNAVAITKGSQSTERYTQYAPEKESGNAAIADINSAGLALYNRGVAFLKDHDDDVTSISCSAVGKNLYANPGDKAFIQANVRQPVIDPFVDEIVEYIDTQLNASYYVSSVAVGFSDDKVTWDFELTDKPVILQEDTFVSIYDQTKREDTPAGAVYAPAFAPTFATINTSQSGGSPDTTLSNGLPAKLVSITLPAAPGSSSGVYLAGISYGTSSFGDVVVELVSDPVFPSTAAVVKIGIKNVGWNNAYSANLVTHIVWI